MRRPAQDERGAVAILTGLLVVFLCVLSAFAIDLGMAYNSKRQLQTGADAGALAAAAVYANAADSNGCNGAFINAHLAEALLAAQDYRERNRPEAADESFAVECVDGGVKVTYGISGNTDVYFGKLVPGMGDTILTDSAAAALVDVPPAAARVRPMAVCSGYLPATIQINESWRVYGPGNGHTPPAGCPNDNAGNWWTLDCPEELDPTAERDGLGGTAQLANQIQNGCSRPISIVPGQEGLAPGALTTHLLSSCPGPSTAAPFDCLSGDPGQPDAGQIKPAWRSLIDSGETFVLPIFCAPSACSASSVDEDPPGQNTVFPVHRIVAVAACGYHFGNGPNDIYAAAAPTAPCSSAATVADVALMVADTTDMNYMILSFQRLQVSGSTGASECDLGDPDCDGGLRRVHLVAE